MPTRKDVYFGVPTIGRVSQPPLDDTGAIHHRSLPISAVADQETTSDDIGAKRALSSDLFVRYASRCDTRSNHHPDSGPTLGCEL